MKPTTHRSAAKDPPEGCCHPRLQRTGIQKFPFPPHRLYLVTCRECGTTLTTLSLRMVREAFASASPSEEEEEPRRRAG
jgi:hypothetical protein